MTSPFLLLLLISSAAAMATSDVTGSEGGGRQAGAFTPDSAWTCVEKARSQGFTLLNFAVLPGFGWDNLRNVHEGPVISFNYSRCRTTDDGRFLLPDSVDALPVKTSRVQYFAELISHWRNWTSTNSRSINVETGFTSPFVSISGRFSDDFSQVKSKQIGEKSVTTRTQLRYVRYKVQVTPDGQLHPTFRKRVLGIAAAHAQEEEDRATYLAEMLVRDYGTHVITKIDAGAALIQDDQIKSTFLQSSSAETRRREIMASATANFMRDIGVSLSFSHQSQASQNSMDNYNGERTSSDVYTEGGPPFLPSGFTANTWATSIDSDMVALDRAGNPLHYVITEETLAELPVAILDKVYTSIRDAIVAYYSFNVIPGCLNPASDNFAPAANMDDESCTPASGPVLKLGGVYQTCSMSRSTNGDLCSALTQVNPLTGTYSCPEDYIAVKLNTGSASSSRSQQECHRHWIFWKRCHTNHYESRAEYNMYWCHPSKPNPKGAGYAFGGVYTNRAHNSVTGSFSCPRQFFPLRIGNMADLKVCVGQNGGVPFGGFYSCQAGNPMAAQGADLSNPSRWPKKCSTGYNAYLATVDKGCQVNFCVPSSNLPGTVVPPIKRPPFCPDPPLSPPQANEDFFFDPVSDTWERNIQSPEASALGLSASGVQSALSVAWLLASCLSLSVFL